MRDVVKHLSQQADLGAYRMGTAHLRMQVQIAATHGMAGVILGRRSVILVSFFYTKALKCGIGVIK